MPRAASSPPNGHKFALMRSRETGQLRIGIWTIDRYEFVYDNNGEPYDFTPELRGFTKDSQIYDFCNRVYKAGS